jgi:hypothetical protein
MAQRRKGDKEKLQNRGEGTVKDIGNERKGII